VPVYKNSANATISIGVYTVINITWLCSGTAAFWARKTWMSAGFGHLKSIK